MKGPFSPAWDAQVFCSDACRQSVQIIDWLNKTTWISTHECTAMQVWIRIRMEEVCRKPFHSAQVKMAPSHGHIDQYARVNEGSQSPWWILYLLYIMEDTTGGGGLYKGGCIHLKLPGIMKQRQELQQRGLTVWESEIHNMPGADVAHQALSRIKISCLGGPLRK